MASIDGPMSLLAEVDALVGPDWRAAPQQPLVSASPAPALTGYLTSSSQHARPARASNHAPFGFIPFADHRGVPDEVPPPIGTGRLVLDALQATHYGPGDDATKATVRRRHELQANEAAAAHWSPTHEVLPILDADTVALINKLSVQHAVLVEKLSFIDETQVVLAVHRQWRHNKLSELMTLLEDERRWRKSRCNELYYQIEKLNEKESALLRIIASRNEDESAASNNGDVLDGPLNEDATFVGGAAHRGGGRIGVAPVVPTADDLAALHATVSNYTKVKAPLPSSGDIDVADASRPLSGRPTGKASSLTSGGPLAGNGAASSPAAVPPPYVCGVLTKRLVDDYYSQHWRHRTAGHVQQS